MADKELITTFLALSLATHTFYRHIQQCPRLHNCDECRNLIEAKNSLQEKYDELVYGSIPPEIIVANIPHDDLAFARKQTD